MKYILEDFNKVIEAKVSLMMFSSISKRSEHVRLFDSLKIYFEAKQTCLYKDKNRSEANDSLNIYFEGKRTYLY
jgi:hypothetical protein